MRKTSKVKFLGNVLLCVVSLVTLLCVLCSVLPQCTSYTICAVQADSMAPEIRKGALVLAKPISFSELQVGDVCVLADPKNGDCFASRIAEIWADQQLVTEDGSGILDPYTTAFSCVQGKVFRQIPYLGYPSVFLHTGLGKVLVALLYIIWLAVEIEVHRVAKRREECA